MAPSPLPIQAVYWIAPGPEPRLWRLAPDARALIVASWNDLGPEWRQRLARDLTPGVDGTVYLDNRDVRATPPGLLLPAPGPPEAALRFVLVQLDADALAHSTLPALVRTHLPFASTFDIAIRDLDAETVLYASGDSTLPSPDLARPIGSALISTVVAQVRDNGDARIVEMNQNELSPGEGLWWLEIQHHTGSIGAAVSDLRWRQRLLALAVLFVLGGAVALLVRVGIGAASPRAEPVGLRRGRLARTADASGGHRRGGSRTSRTA